MRRQLIAEAFVLLASVSNAWADSITYTITPFTVGDGITNGAADTASGAITFSSTTGSVLGTYDINSLAELAIAPSFTLTSSVLGSVEANSATAVAVNLYGSLTLSDTGITLNSGSNFSLEAYDSQSNPHNPQVDLWWYTNSAHRTLARVRGRCYQ